MKKIIFFLLVILSVQMAVAGESYNPEAIPEEQLAEAMAEAKTNNKMILMVFGANWCPDCRAFSKLIKEAPLAETISTNFSVAHIDIGNWDHNMEFTNQFDKPVDKGIPSIVILDQEKNILYVAKGGEFASARNATAEQLNGWFKEKVESFK